MFIVGDGVIRFRLRCYDGHHLGYSAAATNLPSPSSSFEQSSRSDLGSAFGRREATGGALAPPSSTLVFWPICRAQGGLLSDVSIFLTSIAQGTFGV